MRSVALAIAAVVAAFLVAAPASAATCGRPGYPDAGAYNRDAVVDAFAWNVLTTRGGFANATEGQESIEVRVADGLTTWVVRLDEVSVVRYQGGAATNETMLALSVLEVSGGIGRAWFNFTLVDTSRAGGNLTVAAWTDTGALDVYWRWAYLPCDDAFPNVYYVFHGQVNGGAITVDNALVYFEAPRAKAALPADMALMIIAGVAVSGIFLLVWRAMRSGSRPPRESEEPTGRTVK